jgi:hypothetical protein
MKLALISWKAPGIDLATDRTAILVLTNAVVIRMDSGFTRNRQCAQRKQICTRKSPFHKFFSDVSAVFQTGLAFPGCGLDKLE